MNITDKIGQLRTIADILEKVDSYDPKEHRISALELPWRMLHFRFEASASTGLYLVNLLQDVYVVDSMSFDREHQRWEVSAVEQ